MSAVLTSEERTEYERLRWFAYEQDRAMRRQALEAMADKRHVVAPVPIHYGGFVVFEDNVFAVDTEDGETPILRQLGL